MTACYLPVMTTTHPNRSNTMNRIIAATVATVALIMSSFAAAPAFAAGERYVDTFVVPDPSLGSDCIGDGIVFAGSPVDVDWTVNGQPYTFVPGSTLWLPEGGYVNVTATAHDGDTLTELNNNTQGGEPRSGTSLSWQHYVHPTDCTPEPACPVVETSGVQTDPRVDRLTDKIERLTAKADRQAKVIARLRAKLRR